MNCCTCRETNEYAEANLPNGRFQCFTCRRDGRAVPRLAPHMLSPKEYAAFVAAVRERYAQAGLLDLMGDI